MEETVTKVPLKTEDKAREKQAIEPAAREWHPFQSLHREIDRLFDDFDLGFRRSPFGRSTFDLEPFWRRELNWAATPAVDVVEHEKEYEIAAEVPGMDAGNIEVALANGVLTIKGEKKEDKEEKKKNYYLSERRYGSFQRAFRVPDGVDADKIAASFSKGVLKVTLPKNAQAQQKEKKITVKAD